MSEVWKGSHEADSSNHHRHVNRLWAKWEIQIESKEYCGVDGEKEDWTCQAKVSNVMSMGRKRHLHICDSAANRHEKWECKRVINCRPTCLRSKNENCTRQYKLSQEEEDESGYYN